MHRRWSPRTLTLCICLFAGTLTAQEPLRKALVMGLHGPGLYMPITSSAALRADGLVSVSSSGGNDVWTESLNLSGLFYLSTSDALKTYVGPRVGYTYSAPSSAPAHTGTVSGSVFFGTEYSLGRAFGVFGEMGLTFSRTTGARVGPANDAIALVPSNFASTFSGVGLLLHF